MALPVGLKVSASFKPLIFTILIYLFSLQNAIFVIGFGSGDTKVLAAVYGPKAGTERRMKILRRLALKSFGNLELDRLVIFFSFFLLSISQ